MKDERIKTRCYYTDYVNHMIRFYLSVPDGLNLQGKNYSQVSIENWLAVQMVFHRLSKDDSDMMTTIYRMDHYLPKAVDNYCKKTGTDPNIVWKTITRVCAKIARVRKLM